MNAAKFIAYMALWSVGFIAVRSITQKPMQGIQNFIAGTKEA